MFSRNFCYLSFQLRGQQVSIVSYGRRNSRCQVLGRRERALRKFRMERGKRRLQSLLLKVISLENIPCIEIFRKDPIWEYQRLSFFFFFLFLLIPPNDRSLHFLLSLSSLSFNNSQEYKNLKMALGIGNHEPELKMAELNVPHPSRGSSSRSNELGMTISIELRILQLALDITNKSSITTDLNDEAYHFSLIRLPSSHYENQRLHN